MTSKLVSMIFIALMLSSPLAAAQDNAGIVINNSCSFLQPSEYVPNYIRTIEHSDSVSLFPNPNKNCAPNIVIRCEHDR